MKADIVVQGVVQGVGYRFYVLSEARIHNIKGYVRNRSDGMVEVVAEGEEGMVRDFIERLRIGPISAHVSSVDVRFHDGDTGFTDFRLHH